MFILGAFSSMTTVELDDHEVRNRCASRLGCSRIAWHNCNIHRTRLVGLTALNHVVESEALYGRRDHFKDQVMTIVTAFVATIFRVTIPELDHG